MKLKVLLLLVAISNVIDVSAQVSSEERGALIKLYESTNGVGWLDNSGWLGAVGTECSWKGVSCSQNSVSSLLLNGNKLTGIIPVELIDLSNLTRVMLDNNQLTGLIPTGLGELRQLTNLALHDNQLTGPIPTGLSKLSKLMYLGLQNNNLLGTIPIGFGQLSELNYLGLNDNKLTGTIPIELTQLALLETLNLSNNQLSGTIPADLAKLDKLIRLELSDNKLTGVIPSQIASLTQLMILDVSRNQLTGGVPAQLMLHGKLDRFFYSEDLSLVRASVFNGTTPSLKLALELNNVGLLSPADNRVYTCVAIYTDGVAGSIDGEQYWGVEFEIVSVAESTIKLVGSRAFNPMRASNSDYELPDCSGKVETTTLNYSDYILLGNQMWFINFEIEDADSLVFKVVNLTALGEKGTE